MGITKPHWLMRPWYFGRALRVNGAFDTTSGVCWSIYPRSLCRPTACDASRCDLDVSFLGGVRSLHALCGHAPSGQDPRVSLTQQHRQNCFSPRRHTSENLAPNFNIGPLNTTTFSPLTRQPRIHSNNGQGPVTGRELSPQIAKGALQCAE
jgi:hypothetical protein